MILQAAEYALRSVVCLAQRGGRPLTTHEIAALTRVSESYLAKVLQALAKAGIVHAQRGLNGGFKLIKAPQRLTLLEVVRVVDASQRIPGARWGWSHMASIYVHFIDGSTRLRKRLSGCWQKRRSGSSSRTAWDRCHSRLPQSPLWRHLPREVESDRDDRNRDR